MAPPADGTDGQGRDEELQAVTVGPLEPHDAPITLVAYDPDRPRLFRREADRVRAALGPVALRIEHVGSTSVPGLVAKPIIDVLVVPDAGVARRDATRGRRWAASARRAVGRRRPRG